MESILLDKLNYWIFIALMMLGLWAMISKNNLIKKVIGMSIFQSAVILFYVSIGAKNSAADIPIYPHDLIHPAHVETELEASISETKEHGFAETTTGHHPEPNHEVHPRISALINPDDFDNPIPHVLMLTAIVVGVATLGVALALIQRIYRLYGSIEEDEISHAISSETSGGNLMSPDPATHTDSF